MYILNKIFIIFDYLISELKIRFGISVIFWYKKFIFSELKIFFI